MQTYSVTVAFLVEAPEQYARVAGDEQGGERR